MTPTSITILSVRLLAIFTLISAIPYLKSLTEVFAWRGSEVARSQGGPFNTDLILIGILLSFAIQLTVGFLLWFFAEPMVKKVTARDEPNGKEPLTELSAKNVQAIAFSIVGLVMNVIAIPHLVQLAANLQALKSAGSESLKQNVSIGTWAYSIGIAVQFILGILLFLGAKRTIVTLVFISKATTDERSVIGTRKIKSYYRSSCDRYHIRDIVQSLWLAQ